jgi:hypothetical protein
MSFIADPPILYAAGEAYARGAPESAQGRAAQAAGAVSVAACLAVSVALWSDQDWVRPLWRAFGATSGREFQATNGLVRWKGARKAGPREHALAAAGFATYPLWFWLGWDRGRRARP